MKCHQHNHIAGIREEITLTDARQRSFKQRTVFDVTSLTASVFGILAAFLKQSGRSPRTRVNDISIAAQAMENDYALLTADLKDFEGLPGLRVSCS
jgi:predicted nucleic acid-binding protein